MERLWWRGVYLRLRLRRACLWLRCGVESLRLWLRCSMESLRLWRRCGMESLRLRRRRGRVLHESRLPGSHRWRRVRMHEGRLCRARYCRRRWTDCRRCGHRWIESCERGAMELRRRSNGCCGMHGGRNAPGRRLHRPIARHDQGWLRRECPDAPGRTMWRRQ
jgi:hypothetical protein